MALCRGHQESRQARHEQSMKSGHLLEVEAERADVAVLLFGAGRIGGTVAKHTLWVLRLLVNAHRTCSGACTLSDTSPDTQRQHHAAGSSISCIIGSSY